MGHPNAPLRDRLQQITCGEEIPVHAHPQALAVLALEIPHSIIPAPHLAPKLPIQGYNCFEFALGLAGRSEVRLISHFIPSTCCNGIFVAHLVALLLTTTASPGTDGDLVLYRDNQQFTHAGLVHGNRILSKWGTGHLWLHGLLEVPASYGQITVHYRPLDPDVVLTEFLKFSREREGSALVDEVLTLQLDHNVAV